MPASYKSTERFGTWETLCLYSTPATHGRPELFPAYRIVPSGPDGPRGNAWGAAAL